MYDCWRGAGSVAVAYFISLVCLGDWITMNLFLAILLGNFENMDELQGHSVPTLSAQRTGELIKRFSSSLILAQRKSLIPRSASAIQDQVKDMVMKNEKTTEDSDEPVKEVSMMKKTVTEEDSDAPEERDSSNHDQDEESVQNHPQEEEEGDHVKEEQDDAFNPPMLKNIIKKENPSSEPLNQFVVVKHSGNGKALGCISSSNSIRRFCISTCQNPTFDQVILVLIFISSVALAVDSPFLDPDSSLASILSILDTTLTLVFTAEMMIKIIARGFILGNGTYLHDSWNILDFSIVCVSILPLFIGPGNSSLKSLRSLRTLRALRPLRFISRRPGLKLVVNALFRSIPSIANVLFVCILFLMIFSVVGINYFKGEFRACQGDEFDALPEAQVAFLTLPPLDWFENATYVQWMRECPALASRWVLFISFVIHIFTIYPSYSNITYSYIHVIFM